MNFGTAMSAKDFLVGRIVDEANRRRVPLSELERKMLYFSETHDTLPDMMETAEKFGDECKDDSKYETKIRELSRQAFERDRRNSPELLELWKDAIRLLKREDHYLVLMIDVPGSGPNRAKLYGSLAVLVALFIGLYQGALWTLGWLDRKIRFHIPGYLQCLGLVLLLGTIYYLYFGKAGRTLGNWLSVRMDRILMRWL